MSKTFFYFWLTVKDIVKEIDENVCSYDFTEVKYIFFY